MYLLGHILCILLQICRNIYYFLSTYCFLQVKEQALDAMHRDKEAHHLKQLKN